MTNYICINGKKAELTEEQMKALGIELPKKNPFKRAGNRIAFYYITNKGNVEYGVEIDDFHCNELYKAANYCTDKAILEQRALHETLSRLLWRYSMEHDGDKIKWNDPNSTKWFIYYDHRSCRFYAHNKWDFEYLGTISFCSKEIAEAAIKEVIEPFMKAHPEFKW